MRWKFWQKPEASTPSEPRPSIDWPAEACDSLRVLAALYARDVYPFTEWRAPGLMIERDLEPLFRRTVKAHQLHIWFAIYLAQRGEVEAKMLRDALPHVMNEIVPNEGMLDRINNLLEAQSYAVDYFIALPDEQKAAATAPTATLELTLEWHLAFYLLVFNPDSPFVEPDEVPEGQQRALAACLQNASNEAQHAFAPMVLAIRHFDVARLAGWEWWSETMGARERHLQRRHQNPVFAPERRVVTASDVYSARLLDAKDYDEALETLKSIGKALVDFQPVNNWEATLNGMKAQLETLQLRILGMDRRGADLRPKTELLRSHAIGYMTDLLKQVDPGQLPAIEELEARRVQFLARYPCDWSWQVYRGDVIPDDEAALALLCESVESIAQIVKGAEELGQHPIDASHATCLSHAKAEFADIARTLHATGHEIPRFEEKLRILGQRVTC